MEIMLAGSDYYDADDSDNDDDNTNNETKSDNDANNDDVGSLFLL